MMLLNNPVFLCFDLLELYSVDRMESEAVPTPDELREFTHDELGELTDNYSEDNFLGETKYAKFYRGKIETRGEVTVKICKKFIDSACQIPSNEHSRFKVSIFLQILVNFYPLRSFLYDYDDIGFLI